MKYCHSEVMKNQVRKTYFMCIFLVIAPKYFLEQLLKQKIKQRKSDRRFYE